MPFNRLFLVGLVGCASAGPDTSSHDHPLATCDAFTVLSEQPNVAAVQLDDSYAYASWFDDAGNFTIGRLPKQGGNLETIISGGSGGLRWILAGGYVVYATPRTQVGPWELYRVPVDGSDVPQQIFEASNFTDLSTVDGQIYWRVDTNVARIALDGTGYDYLGGFDRVSFMQPASDAIYYMRPVDSTLRQLWRWDLTTRTGKIISTIAPKSNDRFAQNTTSLYWVEWEGNKSHLDTVAKTGGTPFRLATSTDDGMYDPVASDSYVVWQEFIGGGGATNIFELTVGGGQRELVPDSCITGEWGDSIAFDDTNIFLAGMRDDPPPIPTLRRGTL
jgi:hypothetical protein